MQKIAHIESPYKEKFGIPRQSNLTGCRASIVFEEEFRNADALRGLEGFSYIWLIWEFSENGPRWEPTVRPPRLGGNKRMGVWATRSTFRPNPIGLSSVKISGIRTDSKKGPIIEVEGADLMDGTPIYDIKPYIKYADSHPDALCGWVDDVPERKLNVIWDCRMPKESAEITQTLELDPRPAYIDDPVKTYGLRYGKYNIRFKVSAQNLHVVDVQDLQVKSIQPDGE